MGTIIMTSQSYILTLFDAQIDQKWEQLHDAMWDSGKILYIGSQLERCPKSGNLHWQAFVKFDRQNKQRGTWFKKFANGIHFTKCSKERAEAIGYGTKGETRVAGPKENGTKPEAVVKFTADMCKSLILEKRTDEIPFDYVLRYNLEKRLPGLQDFLKLDKRNGLPDFLPNPWGLLIWRNKPTKKRHYWIYSRQPNKGKTYYFAKPISTNYKAQMLVGDTTYFNVSGDTECVIFDEYNTAKFKWDTINAMCDGAFAWRRFNQPSIVLNNPLIIVLSNQSIVDLYPHMNNFILARFIEYEIL